MLMISPISPGQQALLHGHIERRVAQYVADHHPAAGLADGTLQLPHLVLIDGKGLFQKHVVAPAQQRDGGFYMLGIHGAVDDGIGQPGALRQRLGAFKAHILSKPVHLRRFSAADGVRSATPTILNFSGFCRAYKLYRSARCPAPTMIAVICFAIKDRSFPD